MTRLSLALLTALALALPSAVAQDPPKVDPPKSDAPKTDSPARPADEPVVTKSAAGDVGGTVAKVSGSQLTLKIPQQVPNGTATKSVRVPNPARPGQYHTVRQQVPKYKTVQTESTFDLGAAVTVKTAAGKVVDLSVVQAGIPVIIHLTKVKEGKAYEKATDVHVEVTRILVPNQATAPTSGSDPKKD